jgi:hypothetical protein
MGSKSDLLEVEHLKLVTGQTPSGIYTLTAPLTPYLALFTAMPSDTGGGTEVTAAGAYARVLCGGTTFWNVPTSGNPSSVTNKIAISFVQASADWPGPIVGFGLYTAVTVGILLMWGNLTVNKTVLSGDTASFAINQLQLTED